MKYSNIISQTDLIIIINVLMCSILFGQLKLENSAGYFSTERFDDSARHWYKINDQHKIISPLKDQKRYKSFEVKAIADNILLYQKKNGGWPKNYDMLAKLTAAQKDSVRMNWEEENTTFDNGATHSQVSYLAEAYSITKEEKYKEAFFNGLDFILEAQYDNGGYPQFYPDTSGYRKHITFNDNAMIGVMNILQKISQNYPEYEFIDTELRDRVKKAYLKGIDCILKTQIVEDGVKLVWCQQHDSKTFRPANARSFEIASLCNGESVEIVKFLLRIKQPSPQVKEAILSAINWFDKVAIKNIKVIWIKSDFEKFKYHSSKFDRKVVEVEDAPRIWPRFNELQTHRPIFLGRDGIVKYNMSEIDRDRRTGYGWYTYAPEELFILVKHWKIY